MVPLCEDRDCDVAGLGKHGHGKDGNIYFDWERFRCSKCKNTAVVCESKSFNRFKIKCLNCGHDRIYQLCDILPRTEA